MNLSWFTHIDLDGPGDEVRVGIKKPHVRLYERRQAIIGDRSFTDKRC